jgi:hypothetical protein
VTVTVQGTLAATAVTAVARFIVSRDAVGVGAWWLTVQIPVLPCIDDLLGKVSWSLSRVGKIW